MRTSHRAPCEKSTGHFWSDLRRRGLLWTCQLDQLDQLDPTNFHWTSAEKAIQCSSGNQLPSSTVIYPLLSIWRRGAYAKFDYTNGSAKGFFDLHVTSGWGFATPRKSSFQCTSPPKSTPRYFLAIAATSLHPKGMFESTNCFSFQDSTCAPTGPPAHCHSCSLSLDRRLPSYQGSTSDWSPSNDRKLCGTMWDHLGTINPSMLTKSSDFFSVIRVIIE